MLDLSDFHSPVSIYSFWWLLGTWRGKHYVTQLQDGVRVVGSLAPCRLPGTSVSGNLTYLHLYFSPTWQSWLRHTCGLLSLIVVRYWGCSLAKTDSPWLLVMIQIPLGLCHILHQLPNRADLSYCFYLHPHQRETLGRIKSTLSSYLPLRKRGSFWVTSTSWRAKSSLSLSLHLSEPSLFALKRLQGGLLQEKLVKISVVQCFH